MKWQLLKVVWPLPSSTAWRSVVGTPQNPHAVNFTGPLFVLATSIPAMNWQFANDTPACDWTLSTRTAVGPISEPHCVSRQFPGPAWFCTNWKPMW